MKTLIAFQPPIRELIDLDEIVEYILERQNLDGGYTFCRGTESNAQDTFYALNILDMIGVPPRNIEKTISFLKALQHEDGSFDSIKVAYYVVKSLLKFGEKPLRPLKNLAASLDISIRNLESGNIGVEVLSELENIYLLVDLCESLKVDLEETILEETIKAILRVKNADGSFGSSKRSRIASTFFALGALKNLGYEISELTSTLRWIRQCEHIEGGFSHAPEAAPTYLEDTYFGIKSLELLNERIRYAKNTLRFIAKFQNPNGGFRRSIFLGISDFESTYQAVSSIKTLISPLGLGGL